MKEYDRVAQINAIRLLRGLLTTWEKWLQAKYLEQLPTATPEEIVKILTPEKTDKRPNG
jgi:hypothetical protein